MTQRSDWLIIRDRKTKRLFPTKISNREHYQRAKDFEIVGKGVFMNKMIRVQNLPRTSPAVHPDDERLTLMFRYRARLIEVVDGDTVKLSVDLGFKTWVNHTFRLYGINAPETRTTDTGEKALGLRAKQWLKDQLTNPLYSLIIETYKDDQTEKFGRYLATLYLNERNLNQEMIDNHLAKPYLP